MSRGQLIVSGAHLLTFTAISQIFEETVTHWVKAGDTSMLRHSHTGSKRGSMKLLLVDRL